tara:strand:+ start:6232 stop:7464 length:1233 start_codon:yes stop_codon:yes gene_type:complete
MKIKVPSLGESVTEATVAKWLKKEGEQVAKDDVLVELETDKATLEVYAQVDGVLSKIYFNDGEDVQIGSELAELKEERISIPKDKDTSKKVDKKNINENQKTKIDEIKNVKNTESTEFSNIDPNEAIRSGAGKKITSDDLKSFLQGKNLSPSQRREFFSEDKKVIDISNINNSSIIEEKNSRRVPLSRLQKTMAKRLKNAQNTAAMLTTFNEIDMTEVINLRSLNKDAFEKKYQVKLGFMSFFCNAVSIALKEYPIINSEIDGDDIIYHDHIDLGIAVGAPQGLIVPVIRSVNLKSFQEIEREIKEFSEAAIKGVITSEQMSGATFTISNGGVYGSMLSTPILNPPQNAILGLHQIKERPVVINGSINTRSIMYVALTYDHRAISGKEAVSFLYKIKDLIENPDKMLLEL